MHLLAFMKQMPSSSDQSVKDTLADMPDALSLFDMISLSHSKEHFLKQLRKQQADIKANNKTKNGSRQVLSTALAKAQYAITIKTGCQQQGLFGKMKGGFENEHYRRLNQIWDKAVEGGKFELNRVSEILKFLRTADIVTESVSFPKDPQGFSTRQKTQTTALADFSAQLDAVGKTPIGVSLQTSAEALYVKTFLAKDERVPNPPQPQWPAFGTVCYNQLNQPFQWVPPGRWVPIVPVIRGPSSDSGSISSVSDISTSSYFGMQPSQPAIDFDNDAIPANSVPSQHFVQQQPQHSHGGGGEMQMQSRQLVISPPQLSQLSPQQQFHMQQQQQFQQQQFQMQQQQQQHPTTIVPVQPQQQTQMQPPPEPQVTMAGTNDGSVP